MTSEYKPSRARIFVISTTLGLLAAAIPFAALAEPGLSASKPRDIQRAESYLQAEQYRGVTRTCEKAELEGDYEVYCRAMSAIALNAREKYKQAEEAAQQVIQSTENPQLLATGYRELGTALAARARRASHAWTHFNASPKGTERLARAESAFRKALELSEGMELSSKLGLADVLVGRMLYNERWEYEEEIRALLFDYLAEQPEGPAADWARDITCTSEPYAELRRQGDLFHPMAFDTEPQDMRPKARQELGDRLTQPKKTYTAPIRYSAIARDTRFQGVAIFEAVIDEQGKVYNIRPIKRLPLCLTEQAMLSIRDWQFEPATLDGEPIPVHYFLSVNFSIG